MKFFTIACTLLITAAVNCQVQFGVFGGPQVTDVRYIINGKRQESVLKYGVNLGAQLKVPFENRLSFAPSVMYNLRGYKVKFDAPSFPPDSAAIDNNTRFHTVELGFLLQHDFNLQPGHFFLRFGPSLDFALAGTEKFNSNSNGPVNRNMKFSFADYGHYLASAILQFGYEASNGLYFYGHYNYSLTTMNNFDGGPSIGNRAAGVCIGWYFSKNKLVLDTKNKE